MESDSKLSEKKNQKNKEYFQLFVKYFFLIIISVGASVWFVLIFLQFISSNFSYVTTYEQISLTLFGFTFIGGIFEAKNKEEIRVFGNIFYFSLGFLASFLLFLITENLHSLFLVIKDSNLLVAAIMLALFGSMIFVIQIIGMSIFLVKYHREKYSPKEEKEDLLEY